MTDNYEEKIDKIIKERKHAHQFLLKNSKAYKSFIDLEQKTFSDGNLEKKYKELIALGIALIVNCESCMEWHLKEVLNAGATTEQIIETIEVGIEMGGGPATVSSRFALRVLEYYSNNKK
jgi:AhpD family alkylhydroperoxidase